MSGTKVQLYAGAVMRRINFKIVKFFFPYTGSSGDSGMTALHSIGGFSSWQCSRATVKYTQYG